jgi:hypothetical protein
MRTAATATATRVRHVVSGRLCPPTPQRLRWISWVMDTSTAGCGNFPDDLIAGEITVVVRTSESDPIRVDCLDLPDMPGRIGLTFAPGKRSPGRWERDLDADLDRLVQHFGVTHLVSLIEDYELDASGIPELYRAAAQRDITVERFPIPDVSVRRTWKRRPL